MPMAVEGADDITTAVQVEERRFAVGLRRRGPFRANPVGSDRLDGDIPRNVILRKRRVHVLAALPVIIRTHPTG
jgi:hypothetical protein